MILSTLCYIKKEGKTLFLHRIKKENDVHDGKWVGLGGKIEKGETPEECVKREVLEESGLIIKKPKIKGILTFPDFDHGKDCYVYLFEAYDYEGDLLEKSKEGNLKWIKNTKIKDLNMWKGDHLFFKWMKKDKFFSGKLVYKGEELVSKKVIYY
ncbi:MAG: NUDIX hydrolase [Fusobacteriota bacterium]